MFIEKVKQNKRKKIKKHSVKILNNLLLIVIKSHYSHGSVEDKKGCSLKNSFKLNPSFTRRRKKVSIEANKRIRRKR